MQSLLQVFKPQSSIKKQARFAALLWTLLIFTACLWPGKELPQSDIPLIDKWVHFVLFAPFTFLWLSAAPPVKKVRYLQILLLGCFTGFLVEVLQYLLAFLGRSYDTLDIVADAIGALLGVLLFALFARMARK